MNTPKDKILSNELILAWIEGNLSKSEMERVKNLIKASDEAFLKYSTLLASYNEMQAVELEKTPDWLIEKANNELGLVTPLSKPPTPEKLTSKIEHIINSIKWAFKPRITSYAIVSAGILALIILTLLPDMNSDSNDLKDEPLKLFDQLTQPKFQPVVSTELEGVKVTFKDGKIIVTQPMKVKRELSITSQSGKMLISKNIQNIENTINTSSIEDQEIIIIKIKSFDEIIYEATVRIK